MAKRFQDFHKRWWSILIFLCLIDTAYAQDAWLGGLNPPKRETRAVWLTTIGGLDWPQSYARSERSIEKQKESLRRTLDRYVADGLNTVLLQTRIRATMIYPSVYEPWDGCLSGIPGKSPGYDALAFAIEECHKRGLEVHAWIVTIPVGKWNGYGCSTLRKKHPNMLKKIGEEGFLNPERMETRIYLADICEEITRKYDIDGLHLDYIRYPEEWKGVRNKAQARENITAIVQAIHNRIKPLKPWVSLSCSPIGKYTNLTNYSSKGWDAYNRVYQDAQKWLKDGLMDALYPMMYFKDNQFFPFAIDWQENAYGKTIVPGLGLYQAAPQERNWSASDISRQMETLRYMNMGYCFFRSRFLTDNIKGLEDYTKTFNRTPALTPALAWETNTYPEKPELRWDASKHTLYYSSSGDVSYNIYVDNRLTLGRTSIQSIPIKKNHEYRICAMDRYGMESEPAIFSTITDKEATAQEQIHTAYDGYVSLPNSEYLSDKDIIVFSTLQGGLIQTGTLRNGKIDVRALKNGIYIVRSINTKGKTHKIGTFIKRSFAEEQ